jgi:hypothetical protein
MHGGMMLSTEANSWFVHQNSPSILPGESSTSKQEEWPEGMRIWPSKFFIHTCKWFLHAVKAYDMVLPALLPLLGKLCYRLPSPLKIYHLGWVTSPQTLGPVASTVTIAPLRRLIMPLQATTTL